MLLGPSTTGILPPRPVTASSPCQLSSVPRTRYGIQVLLSQEMPIPAYDSTHSPLFRGILQYFCEVMAVRYSFKSVCFSIYNLAYIAL